MAIVDRIKQTFLDKDGAYCLPEISVALGGAQALASAAWDFWYRGHSPDLQAFGLGLSAVVVAMGAAQRIRDGLWHKDEDR